MVEIARLFPNEPQSADTNFCWLKRCSRASFQDATRNRTHGVAIRSRQVGGGGLRRLLSYDQYEKLLVDRASARNLPGTRRASRADSVRNHRIRRTRKRRGFHANREGMSSSRTRSRRGNEQLVLDVGPPVERSSNDRAPVSLRTFDRDCMPRRVRLSAARALVPPDDKEQEEITEKLADAVYKQAANQAVATRRWPGRFLRVALRAPATYERSRVRCRGGLVGLKACRRDEVLDGFRSNHRRPLVVGHAQPGSRTRRQGRARVQQANSSACERRRKRDFAVSAVALGGALSEGRRSRRRDPYL